MGALWYSSSLVVLILGTGYYIYRQVARSTKEIQTSQSTTNTQSDAEEFNNLYDAFYTDSNKTALKNSQFDKLSQLKTLLDKLEGSREYTLAKSKYDSLATQIKAIQDVNAQFEKQLLWMVSWILTLKLNQMLNLQILKLEIRSLIKF